MTNSSAASALGRFGAKPPSSPTLVLWPDGVEDFAVHRFDGFPNALAEIPVLVAVAQFDRLVRARRRARGNCGAAN
jgi:hypothetical protein